MLEISYRKKNVKKESTSKWVRYFSLSLSFALFDVNNRGRDIDGG